MTIDLLIIGAGPAGMTAAITARRHGLSVAVVDDQPAPGGQIWRSVETAKARDVILGPTFFEGREVAQTFRACGAEYLSGAQLWRLDPGFTAYVSIDQQTRLIQARAVILATGAQERPNPFSGWTLPGVLTVGAGQILLKNAGQIPVGPVWIAGSGPLPLLYAVQLLNAGGQIAGFLDTTPAGQWRSALRHLPRALLALSDLVKGLAWMRRLRRSGIPIVRNVRSIAATGSDRLEGLEYKAGSSSHAVAAVSTLLVHEGVVPSIHVPLSMNCEVTWNEQQCCFVPKLDPSGASSVDNLFVAGDGAGIAGANAARLRGELAAIAVASKLGFMSTNARRDAERPVRRRLKRELAVRPFLDAMFRPRDKVLLPDDDTVICRCEGVTAAQVREVARIGAPGPNQVKAATRAGMGPCQGRQCGYTLLNLIAGEQQRSPADVGFLHVRPPLKPVTLGELASVPANR